MADLVFDPDKLWRIMARKHVSPRALVDELGIEPRTYGKWATGAAEPRPISLNAISKALGVQPRALLSERKEQ
jgi:transcriptional regulator with XRE-family HTH domain